LTFGRLTFGRLTFGRLTFNHRPVFLRATKKAGRKLSGCTKSTEIGTREQIKSVLANIRDRCYFIILKNILAKKIDKTLATFCSKYCYFFRKLDHNIGFLRKSANIVAEKERKLPKIVIICNMG
jgi:hypothetical protein